MKRPQIKIKMPLGHTKTELYNPIPQEEGEDTEASNGLLSYPASDTECHQRHARDGISPTQRWLRLLLEISGLLVILVLIYCLVALRKNAGQASQRLLEGELPRPLWMMPRTNYRLRSSNAVSPVLPRRSLRERSNV